MRGVDGNGSEQQIELSFAVVFDKGASIFIEFIQTQDPNPFFRKLRAQLFIPALLLLANELVHLLRDNIALFGQGQPVVGRELVATGHKAAAEPRDRRSAEVIGKTVGERVLVDRSRTGGIRRWRRGSPYGETGGLRWKLRSGKFAFNQRPLRLSPEPRSRPCHCSSDSEQ